jgi:hypothetical protein
VLGLGSAKAPVRAKLTAAAEQRLKALSSASTGFMRPVLQEVVDRVVVHTEKVEVLVSKSKMRDSLLAIKGGAVARRGSDVVRLVNKIRFKRCGVENRIVTPVTEAAQRPTPSLIKAIARGHDWYQRLTAGEVGSRRDLTEAFDVDESYIGRVIRCAFLAPDIVEAIIEGRQRPDLTLQALQRSVPSEWAAQRRHFDLQRANGPMQVGVRGMVGPSR